MTRTSSGFATAIAVFAVLGASCSSGDDDFEPTQDELDEIGEVLCEQQRTEGSVFTGSQVLDLTDC